MKMFAVSNQFAKPANALLFRDGVTTKNSVGSRWIHVFPVNLIFIDFYLLSFSFIIFYLSIYFFLA